MSLLGWFGGGRPVVGMRGEDGRSEDLEMKSGERDPAAARPRVLVIDDETGVLRAMRRVLSGCDVSLAASGAEGLEIMRVQEFDVIFCDLSMPGFSGMEVYREIQRAHPGSLERVVFLSGGAYTTEAERFLEAVPNHRVDKPFAPAQLRSLVASLTRTGTGENG